MRISLVAYVVILVLFLAALLAFALADHRRQRRKGWVHIPRPPLPPQPRRQPVDDDHDDPDDPYNYSGSMTGF